LKKYNLAKNSEKLVQDGWGGNFAIQYMQNRNDFKITSPAYDRYMKKLNKEVSADDEE